ncbi:MAG TPA: hypothetical protein VHR97_10400 [Candidatus Baltobacteraceae bacterium]|jgi:hypothetical protein|nr:hypothetical protein [Candidatus Baltobacteraceae bacterium]
MRPATATPTPIPYKFTIVDDPNSNHNQVTGINNRSKIVGVWGGGSGSSIWESYTTESPYAKLRDLDDPDAQGTFATSITSNKLIAGYVLDPKKLHGIYAFEQVKSTWNLLHDPNEGKGKHAVTEILGMNDSELAVGFYENRSPGGTKIPFVVNVPYKSFTDLQPPAATGDAAATGINGKGNIIGWETTSGGVKSFFLQTGTYYPFYYSGGTATYALGMNWSDMIVGYYLDSNNAPHGFLLIGPSKGGGQQDWQTIDVPYSIGTVVSGINNHHVICGYYFDASGVQHGFVGNPGK